MSETETPKTKKPRGPVKSVSDKLRLLAEAKRTQVGKLAKRSEAADRAASEAIEAFNKASAELKKLEAAIGAAS